MLWIVAEGCQVVLWVFKLCCLFFYGVWGACWDVLGGFLFDFYMALLWSLDMCG